MYLHAHPHTQTHTCMYARTWVVAARLTEGGASVIVSSRSVRVGDSGLVEVHDLITLLAVAADVGDQDDARSMLCNCSFALASVLHAAGVLRDKLFRSMAADDLTCVWAAKARAASHLGFSSSALSLRGFSAFSSWVSTFGSVGQANYAATNMVRCGPTPRSDPCNGDCTAFCCLGMIVPS